jgi:hypothetical protein
VDWCWRANGSGVDILGKAPLRFVKTNSNASTKRKHLHTPHLNTCNHSRHTFLSPAIMQRFIITWALALGVTLQVCAQKDTVRHDERNFTNPESFYNSELPKDTEPFRDSVRLEENQVPKKLKKTLQRDKLYHGWEDAGIYFNTNTKLYMLYLPVDSMMRKYGFDEYGKVVTFTQFIRQP